MSLSPLFPQVRDGYWYKSPLLAKLCGNSQPEPIISTGSRSHKHKLHHLSSKCTPAVLGWCFILILAVPGWCFIWAVPGWCLPVSGWCFILPVSGWIFVLAVQDIVLSWLFQDDADLPHPSAEPWSQRLRSPGGQKLDCQDVRLFDCQTVRMSVDQAVRLSDCQTDPPPLMEYLILWNGSSMIRYLGISSWILWWWRRNCCIFHYNITAHRMFGSVLWNYVV